MEWMWPGTSICGRYPCQPPVDLAIPDAYDQATTYLLLAELARRVGLDPTWGLGWYRVSHATYGSSTMVLGWSLRTLCDSAVFVGGHIGMSVAHVRYVPGIDTTDPALALCMALEATAPKEEG
jgi:hypothetical protein